MAFQTGQSGNPAGRPKGSVNRQLKTLREAADMVLPLVLERALAGDFEAQKFLIERGVPRLKPIAPTEEYNVPEGPLSYQLEAIIRQVSSGELSSTAAAHAVQMLLAADKAKVIEIDTAEVKARRQAVSQASTGGSTYLALLQGRLTPPSD